MFETIIVGNIDTTRATTYTMQEWNDGDLYMSQNDHEYRINLYQISIHFQIDKKSVAGMDIAAFVADNVKEELIDYLWGIAMAKLSGKRMRARVETLKHMLTEDVRRETQREIRNALGIG